MGSTDLRSDLRYVDIRVVYRPSPERLPRWLQRVWAWF
jgi:hypothetical protein